MGGRLRRSGVADLVRRLDPQWCPDQPRPAPEPGSITSQRLSSALRLVALNLLFRLFPNVTAGGVLAVPLDDPFQGSLSAAVEANPAADGFRRIELQKMRFVWMRPVSTSQRAPSPQLRRASPQSTLPAGRLRPADRVPASANAGPSR